MGYDVSASVMQGYKLNDFFESHCEDDLQYIYNVFEDYWANEDEKDWLPTGTNEGVSVDRPGYEQEEHYIGMYTKGGSVSNRGGPSESIFELRNPVLVKLTIIKVMRKVDLPLFTMIADMMETREVKNYLLLSESF